MSPTDINPLKAGKWSPIQVDYNNREKVLLQELAKPQYDSSISKNKFDVLFGDVYIAKKPNSLKSADAVTFDNKGVRIPLGERDNFNINDIRYAIAPILAGGIGYGAYRNQKASGGSIHIAPSKRGTFTAAASKHGMGVQEFANRVLANKENYSPAMVKKANFARNASHWKHGLGGSLLDIPIQIKAIQKA
jgi:hypothetical protein